MRPRRSRRRAELRVSWRTSFARLAFVVQCRLRILSVSFVGQPQKTVTKRIVVCVRKGKPTCFSTLAQHAKEADLFSDVP
jgi:hypothetical protein